MPRLSNRPLPGRPEKDISWDSCPIDLLSISFTILPKSIGITRCSVGTPSTSSLPRDWTLYKSVGKAPLGKRPLNSPMGSSIPGPACPNIPVMAEASMRTQPTPGRLANISSSAITISIRIPPARVSISITRRIRPLAAFVMSKDSGSLCPCVIISISTWARKLCNSPVSSRDRWRSWASGDAMPPPPPPRTPAAPPDALRA